MKRVCLVANSAFTLLNFRRELIQLFRHKGCEVFVICPAKCALVGDVDITHEFAKLEATFLPVKLSRSGLNPLADLSTLKELILHLSKIKPDLVLNYTIKPTIYASIAAYLCSVPTIVSNITGLGYVFTDKGLKARIISSIVKLQYRLALLCNDVVFFQNPDDRALFFNYGLLQAGKTRLINGSGVDTKKYIRIKALSKAMKFLFVGRLLKDKGIYEFIEAAKLVNKKYPQVEFNIVGSYDDNPNSLSVSEISELENQNNIHYLGTTTNMVEVYEQHDVFVLPSYREGTPRSTLEALSMEMPVITTDAPGCRETVEHGVNGFLVPLQSGEKIADAMIRLIESPDMVRRYSAASRELAIKKYDVQTVNESIFREIGMSLKEAQTI